MYVMIEFVATPDMKIIDKTLSMHMCYIDIAHGNEVVQLWGTVDGQLKILEEGNGKVIRHCVFKHGHKFPCGRYIVDSKTLTVPNYPSLSESQFSRILKFFKDAETVYLFS